MAIPKLTGAQVDFTGGEVDASAQRSSQALAKTGVRQARNMRALNTGGLTNRPGRRVLFEAVGRVDKVVMKPGLLFYLHFGDTGIRIRNNDGLEVFAVGGQPWTAATVKDLRWAVYGNQIAITLPGMIPKVLTLVEDIGAWTLADYAEQVIGNQKRTPFYRLAPKGITLTVSGVTGPINITFSAPVLNGPMTNTRIRFNGRQMTITSVTDSQHGTANVNEPLVSNRQTVTVNTMFYTPAIGDVLTAPPGGNGATGVTLSVSPPSVVVELTTATRFQIGDTLFDSALVVGAITAVADAPPAASVVWDQEIMSASAGYPISVFFDQTRLGFAGFPSVPGAIVWSAVNAFTDLYPDAFAADGLATDAIFEITPGKSQVLNVMGGAEANEFVFCDNSIYYIPISPSNPLKPGSVSFILVTADGASAVQPRLIDEVVIYIAAGGADVMAIVATGFTTRLYRAIALTEFYTHLFSTAIAIACPNVGGDMAERYMYVLNDDGSLAVGKYAASLKDLKEGTIGWLPWSGGNGKWVDAANAEVVFTTEYGAPAESLAELLDNSRYLDASQLYNTQPAGLPIPAGKGPLWYMANQNVDLVDGGARMMGTYQVDADGFLIPQFQGGEDFTSPTLTVGQAWTATFEPFTSIASPGQDVGQRVKLRRITRFTIYAEKSTGFLFADLFGGPQTPSSPPLGTIMQVQRVPAWNVGDNPVQPPPQRAGAFFWRPAGRSYDPRNAVIKDTPGPLTITEAAMEITV